MNRKKKSTLFVLYLVELVFTHLFRLESWLDSTDGKKLLLIEIGAGFNTPSVIRYRLECIYLLVLTSQRLFDHVKISHTTTVTQNYYV